VGDDRRDASRGVRHLEARLGQGNDLRLGHLTDKNDEFHERNLSFKSEIIAEARVPVLTTKDPKAFLQEDIDAACALLTADLQHQVKTRSDLAQIRQQFERQIHLYPPAGKPKPPILEVVDSHDWALLWSGLSTTEA
jgi:hypothetical protein